MRDKGGASVIVSALTLVLRDAGGALFACVVASRPAAAALTAASRTLRTVAPAAVPTALCAFLPACVEVSFEKLLAALPVCVAPSVPCCIRLAIKVAAARTRWACTPKPSS